MSGPLVKVDNLKVTFQHPDGDKVAVRGISFDIHRGQSVALVGESGSGKSLTSLALLRLTPYGSSVSADMLGLEGADLMALDEKALTSIRGRRISMIFQNPMSALNPVLTIGRQITESLHRHLGLKGGVGRSRAIELMQLVEISDPLRRFKQYPHQLSGGMQQRAMIAIALACNPDLLIADEPTTALDVTLQAQIMALLAHLQAEMGMAMLLISHDLGVVAETASVVNVMYAGQIVERAPTRQLFSNPQHPYTRALLKTFRDLESATGMDLTPIPGIPPALGKPIPGCAFAPRCAHAVERCLSESPRLREVGESHIAACHFSGTFEQGVSA
ncbi:ABC transporter ATP-binding protein [Devosia sp. YIM 151766]|uniref:ABC transporter ATP-binding protein n=1 Tax=Devosia sp. YIM 151766 TaxID=3017325 RepID=UPI00255CFE21|nr:ABC transporter ATP-binding protein [Devosia sp. YIM 151766]WIY52087.1 ABC transporter ATP-binding protein [Devosia sp. YIM 151766]